MEKNIRKKILPLFAAGCMVASSLFGGDAVDASEEKSFNPRASTTLSRMQTDDGGVNRAEILVNNLPFNSDIFAYIEDSEEAHFNKYRVQSVPAEKNFERGSVGIGAAAQHTNPSFADSKDQLGLVGRIQGAPTENTFSKADIRFFPEDKDFEGYALLDTDNFYFDLLGGYNTESRNAYAIPGADIKIHENLSIGVETGFSGKDRLENDYTGIRAKLHF